MALSYFINRKKTTCVITLKGSITSNDAELLDACLNETLAEPSKYIIVNMGGIKEVEPSVNRAFTLFQQALRGKGKLFVCDIQADPAKVLRAEGVLRENEIAPDLMSCLQMIINAERG